MQTFVDNNIPLTVGVIGDAIGEDSKMREFLLTQNNNIYIASHGIGNIPFTEFSKEDQDTRLKESTQLIKEKLDVTTQVFIPPQNRFNEDTKQVLVDNGFTHISSSLLHGDPPPFPLSGEELYRFPEMATTGIYDAGQNVFVGVSQEKTFEDIIKGLESYGFAVITSHPQEFSTVVNGTYLNQVNVDQISELELLIDNIQQEGIKIVLIKEINLDSKSQVPSWIKNNAGWWADGSIDDDTFIQGIEYLVKNGIITY
jgi:peptidoglycan/xylan/chitin deacetylase (PgdA/CDA1 family)